MQVRSPVTRETQLAQRQQYRTGLWTRVDNDVTLSRAVGIARRSTGPAEAVGPGCRRGPPRAGRGGVEANTVKPLSKNRWPPLTLPSTSNLRIGSRSDPAQELPPQRSIAHRLPSGSISTPAVDPHARSSWSFPQPSMLLYGLGRSLIGTLPSRTAATSAGASAAAGSTSVSSKDSYWFDEDTPT